jgi:hypothetical protein
LRPQLFLLSFDIVDRLFDRCYLLGIFVRNVDIKGLFKSHYKLDNIQRVGSEVIDKGCVRVNLVFIHSQLFNDDLLYLFCYRHSLFSCARKRILALGEAARANTLRYIIDANGTKYARLRLSSIKELMLPRSLLFLADQVRCYQHAVTM